MRWEVYDSQGRLIEPLKVAEGVTQADIVKKLGEVFDSYDKVFYISQVGSGKSLIALETIYNFFDGGIIVVPTKHLQKQYYKDYSGGRFTIPNLKISFILGRRNFICPYRSEKGKTVTADAKDLPCTRKLEGNEKRYEVAAECPYWQPRYPVKGNLIGLIALKIRKEYNFYHTKDGVYAFFYSDPPCPYLNQYSAYVDSSVIVMNDKLWLLETLGKRKKVFPRGLEVFDEFDAFLDRVGRGWKIKWERFKNAEEARKIAEMEEREEMIGLLKDTANFAREEIEAIDKLVEAERIKRGDERKRLEALIEKIDRILDVFDDLVWLCDKEGVYFYFKSPKRFLQELFRLSNKKLLFMSATMQSKEVLEKFYGIKDYCVIYGRVIPPGKLKLLPTKRWHITHKNWDKLREKVFKEMFSCIEFARKIGYKTIIQVHAFKYVPKGIPLDSSKSDNLERFLKGEIDVIASTRIKRGVDFNKQILPKKQLIIPKFPLPDKEAVQIKALFKTFPENVARAVWYDMAYRDLLQQIGRVLRSEDDEAYLSVLDTLALKWLSKSNYNIVINQEDKQALKIFGDKNEQSN